MFWSIETFRTNQLYSPISPCEFDEINQPLNFTLHSSTNTCSLQINQLTVSDQ